VFGHPAPRKGESRDAENDVDGIGGRAGLKSDEVKGISRSLEGGAKDGGVQEVLERGKLAAKPGEKGWGVL